MKIPKSFNLMGHTYVVEHDSTLERTNEVGHVYYLLQKIVITTNNVNEKIKEEAFWHELVHAILNMMRSDKDNDETFVELFGKLLHQAITTMEY